MLVEGNSSDTPPLAFQAILSRARRWCVMISCKGVADVLAILFSPMTQEALAPSPYESQGVGIIRACVQVCLIGIAFGNSADVTYLK